MPKQVLSVNDFLSATKRPDVKFLQIVRINDETAKFKLKTTKNLFTLTVKKSHMIQSIIDSIPSNIKYEIIDKKVHVDEFFKVDEEK